MTKIIFKKKSKGLPWWYSGQRIHLPMKKTWFNSWCKKMPHAVGN